MTAATDATADALNPLNVNKMEAAAVAEETTAARAAALAVKSGGSSRCSVSSRTSAVSGSSLSGVERQPKARELRLLTFKAGCAKRQPLAVVAAYTAVGLEEIISFWMGSSFFLVFDV